MLKHFHLGRHANFPAIFFLAVTLLFGAGLAIFYLKGEQPLGQHKGAFEILIAAVSAAAAFVYFLYDRNHKDTQLFVSLFRGGRRGKLPERL